MASRCDARFRTQPLRSSHGPVRALARAARVPCGRRCMGAPARTGKWAHSLPARGLLHGREVDRLGAAGGVAAPEAHRSRALGERPTAAVPFRVVCAKRVGTLPSIRSGQRRSNSSRSQPTGCVHAEVVRLKLLTLMRATVVEQHPACIDLEKTVTWRFSAISPETARPPSESPRDEVHVVERERAERSADHPWPYE